LTHVADTLARRHYGGLPLPPEDLRLHVGAKTSPANFMAQGINSSERVLELFGEHPSGPVLDWGCGSGRTLRWLWHLEDWRKNYVGCDVDAEAIGWLRRSGIANVDVCDDDPPLPYPADHFSGVFAFSVLTHIHPASHRAWYEELRRVMRKDATAYLTFQGSAIVHSPVYRIPKAVRREFEANDYAYLSQEGHYKDAAFVSEAFVRRMLDGLFVVESFQPTGYQNMDACLVRVTT
jgi:SAM-dependent methyltransferase